jgi:hypothetical protein
LELFFGKTAGNNDTLLTTVRALVTLVGMTHIGLFLFLVMLSQQVRLWHNHRCFADTLAVNFANVKTALRGGCIKTHLQWHSFLAKPLATMMLD